MGINKPLPGVVMRFNLESQEPEREWTVHNERFGKQENIKVKVWGTKAIWCRFRGKVASMACVS